MNEPWRRAPVHGAHYYLHGRCHTTGLTVDDTERAHVHNAQVKFAVVAASLVEDIAPSATADLPTLVAYRGGAYVGSEAHSPQYQCVITTPLSHHHESITTTRAKTTQMPLKCAT